MLDVLAIPLWIDRAHMFMAEGLRARCEFLFSVDCVARFVVPRYAVCFSGTGYGAKHRGRTSEPWLFHCCQTKMTFELWGLCIVIVLAGIGAVLN